LTTSVSVIACWPVAARRFWKKSRHFFSTSPRVGWHAWPSCPKKPATRVRVPLRWLILFALMHYVCIVFIWIL
jgi:hypothetical protein